MGKEVTNEKIYFEYLDVVRFLAAFMILILHSYESWVGWYNQIGFLSGGTYEVLTPFGKLIDTLIKNFGVGVDIFFLISGFLITYILIEEKRRLNTISIGKFMIRRSLRIWPLYFFLIIIAPLLVGYLEMPEPNYLMFSVFLGNFSTIVSQDWTYPFAHFWSICIEEHFYLVWPFLIYFIPKKHLLKTFATVILLSIAFRVYSAYFVDDVWYTIYLHTLSRIDVLVIGAVGAYFYSEKPFKFELTKYIRLLLVALLVFALSIEAVSSWETVFMVAFKKYFYIGIFAVLILDYNFNPNFKHLLPIKSFVHYLGKISYGIYMYGNIVYLVVIKKIMQTYHISNLWFYFSTVIILTIIVSVISYELFEKQILKLNKRFRVIKTER